MKSYPLIRIGRLLATKASLKDKGGIKVLTLLIDTGSTYTVVPVEALESVGCSPVECREHVRIVTGSGILMAPRLCLESFSCLGLAMKTFPIVGHTLPPSGPIDGLLGMDFLVTLRARIDLVQGVCEIPGEMI